MKSGLGLVEGSLVVFDTGGGSSQFTFGHGEHVDERFSLEVGAVRFTEQYGLDGVVSDDVLATALEAIAADLVRLEGRPTPDALVAMGGAVTNLAAVKHELARYDPDVVQGTVLDRAEIDRQIELYRTRTVEQAAPDRGPATQTGRRHPRGRLHRAHGAREARPGLAHRERPRPQARPARRSVRGVGSWPRGACCMPGRASPGDLP